MCASVLCKLISYNTESIPNCGSKRMWKPFLFAIKLNKLIEIVNKLIKYRIFHLIFFLFVLFISLFFFYVLLSMMSFDVLVVCCGRCQFANCKTVNCRQIGAAYSASVWIRWQNNNKITSFGCYSDKWLDLFNEHDFYSMVDQLWRRNFVLPNSFCTSEIDTIWIHIY